MEQPLTVSELRGIVRGVDPAAFVVPGRIVRRAIKHDRGLPKLSFRVPHRMVFAIGGASASEVVDRDELGLGPAEPMPGTLIFLAEPGADELAERPRAEILRVFWRRLFHARVHVAIEGRFADGSVDASGLLDRIRRLDPSAFEEARSVLRLDELLCPPGDDRAVYVEFAATYLGLRMFAGYLIPRYFPAIQDYDAVDRTFGEDVDAEAILASTRLPGASDSTDPAWADPDEADREGEDDGPGEPEAEAPSFDRHRTLIERADRAESRGNLVRSAILRAQAARLVGRSRGGQARSAAHSALERLAVRLKAALGLDEAGLRDWRKALVAPLERSSRGAWTAEARLLYDLQKVCLDHERPFYAVDLVEWASTFGRRPIRRLLPNHELVLMTQHLRAASRHLASSRMPEAERARLARLLAQAVHRAEDALRDRLRPEIGRVLEETGFGAGNLPERVALQKINEELLDRVVHRGFLAIGDLRDALSRNNRKLPDVAGPWELIAGDRLLRADRKLAVALDGVYRRGEVYLRLLQKVSALAFGTRTGRALTRYVALPYGGAFVVLEGLKHLIGPISHRLIHEEVDLTGPITLGVVGTVAVGLLNSKSFREAFARDLGRIGGLIRTLVLGVPSWLLNREVVRRVFASRAFSRAWRALLLPSLLAALAWAFRPHSVGPGWAVAVPASIFVTASVTLSTRAGRNLEEMAFDGLVRAWGWLVSGLLPGLFRLVMDVFDRILEAVERVLYSVDEWLRFRGGQGRGTLAAKAILGVGWFLVSYVVRFAVTILVEPQVNPIKHFPVVTVSHKILLSQVVLIDSVMIRLFGKEFGRAVEGTFFLLTPGVFGFLVWELKENWRLYEANRPKALRPVAIGHHGETMGRLFKPGFHSGTVPKLFARLRRAERKALKTGQGKWARKQLAHLHEVEEAVRQFVDREFLALLGQSRAMGGEPLAIGEVVPGSKRFAVDLIRPGRPGRGLRLAFEEHSGWLVAGIVEPGWLADLSPEARDAVSTALAGLYKMAGVDLVREPIVEALGPEAPAYDFRREGLVVWPVEGSPSEALYLLRAEPPAPPLVTIDEEGNPSLPDAPQLDPNRLLFGDVSVTWKDWVAVWEADRAGRLTGRELVDGIGLLPAEAKAPGSIG